MKREAMLLLLDQMPNERWGAPWVVMTGMEPAMGGDRRAHFEDLEKEWTNGYKHTQQKMTFAHGRSRSWCS